MISVEPISKTGTLKLYSPAPVISRLNMCSHQHDLPMTLKEEWSTSVKIEESMQNAWLLLVSLLMQHLSFINVIMFSLC